MGAVRAGAAGIEFLPKPAPLDRGRPVEIGDHSLQPLARDAGEERDETALALVGVRRGGDAGLRQRRRHDAVLGRESGMERLRHGAELALGAGGEAGGEAERGGWPSRHRGRAAWRRQRRRRARPKVEVVCQPLK